MHSDSMAASAVRSRASLCLSSPGSSSWSRGLRHGCAEPCCMVVPGSCMKSCSGGSGGRSCARVMVTSFGPEVS